MWTQNDFDLLAGFNLYRSTTPDGDLHRINSGDHPARTSVPSATPTSSPGVPYYYKFTVVKTDMTESDFSNVGHRHADWTPSRRSSATRR